MFTVQLPKDSKQEHFRIVQTEMYHTHKERNRERDGEWLSDLDSLDSEGIFHPKKKILSIFTPSK